MAATLAGLVTAVLLARGPFFRPRPGRSAGCRSRPALTAAPSAVLPANGPALPPRRSSAPPRPPSPPSSAPAGRWCSARRATLATDGARLPPPGRRQFRQLPPSSHRQAGDGDRVRRKITTPWPSCPVRRLVAVNASRFESNYPRRGGEGSRRTASGGANVRQSRSYVFVPVSHRRLFALSPHLLFSPSRPFRAPSCKLLITSGPGCSIPSRSRTSAIAAVSESPPGGPERTGSSLSWTGSLEEPAQTVLPARSCRLRGGSASVPGRPAR